MIGTKLPLKEDSFIKKIVLCESNLTQFIAPQFSLGQYFQVYFDHFLIHCNKLIIDPTNSCPLVVSFYSTRGGISLYACLSNIPRFLTLLV